MKESFVNALKTVRIIRKIFLLPVRFYQKFISPGLPARCKYYPTCSQYAVEAVERYGIIVGGALAVWRVLRCNPWSKGGIDYVPEDLFGALRKKK